MQYMQTTLSNGLRIVHYPVRSTVSYCGFAVHTGSRDESEPLFGMAHFTEHMLFKGTDKRRSHHILNRMESVGGELNAYTSKEETIVYAISMTEHAQRACELMCDLVTNSKFPEKEIEKEVDVILDEINSYKDNPPELIYDEFENALFAGHELGHNILGEPETLDTFTPEMGQAFLKRWYHPQNMIFFSVGSTPFDKIIQYVERYFKWDACHFETPLRLPATVSAPFTQLDQHDTHQSHVLIGNAAFDIFDKRRIHLSLLNNILGGPGMNSLLNVSLREKRGLVYQVESNYTPYTDTGVFNIYFGTDPAKKQKCIDLVHKEMKKLRDTSLTAIQLTRAKNQMKGQMGISADNKENIAMGLAKSFLHHGRYDSLEQAYNKIDAITAADLQEAAQIIFDPNHLSTLIYE